MQTDVPTLLGVTNLSLLRVTPSASTAAANPPMLPSHKSPVTMSDTITPAPAVTTGGSTLETVTSQVGPVHSKHLHADYPPIVTKATTEEQIPQVCDNLTVSVDTPAMEVS